MMGTRGPWSFVSTRPTHCKLSPAARPLCQSKPITGAGLPQRRDTCRTRAEADESNPWNLGYQMNERFLDWGDAGNVELLKLVLARDMDVSTDSVQERLLELARVLPDMAGRLGRTRADILLPLLRDMPGVVLKMVELRELLAGVNVSLLVSQHPQLFLLDWTTHRLRQRLADMRSQLPGLSVELLVEAEPMLLHADLARVLDNARRLLPAEDPFRVLATRPQMLLDMVSAGMPSAADVEGSPTSRP